LRPIVGSIRVPMQHLRVVGMPCMTFSVSSEKVYMEVFLMSYPFVTSLQWDSLGYWPRDEHMGITRYFIEVPLCLMMSKTSLVSL
jgi:hypothetical protein